MEWSQGGLLVPEGAGRASGFSNEVRQRALSLVREEYESVIAMATLPLNRLNRRAAKDARYRNRTEVLRDHMGRANAVASFAVALGLIEPQDMKAMVEHIVARVELLGDIPTH